MNIKNEPIYNTKQFQQIKLKGKITNIKCDYFLQKLFDNLPKKKLLEIIKYNKTIQKRINLNINDYKKYSEMYSSIEIEIIEVKRYY